MGRFLSRDTWGGDYNNPLSLNRWMYGYGNPVKYTDPDYGGTFVTGFIGVSGPPGEEALGFSVGIGKTGFFSPYDPMIRGSATYLSFGFGVDIVPLFIDGGYGLINSLPVNKEKPPHSYLDINNKNNVQMISLYTDILLGKNNVWITRSILGYFALPDLASRMRAANKALWYAMVYEELH